MSENYRKSIASLNNFPQFTTMNVIDGQAGIIICSSLIFYSLTIDNILNIIVLLILAGVSIVTLTGDNGILTQANNSKTKTKEAGALEKVKVEVLGSYGTDGKVEIGMLKENLANVGTLKNPDATVFPIEVTVDGYDFSIDRNGTINQLIVSTDDTKPYLLEGATVLESDLDKGITIKDSKNDEWVWIEVPKSIYTSSAYTVANNNTNVTSSTDYTGIYNVLNKYAEAYREGKSGQGYYWTDEWYDGSGNTASTSTNLNDTTGCGLTYNEYQNLYKKMLESVFTNGGFYIGRYEAGIEGTTGEIVEGDTTITDLARTSSSSRIDSSSPRAISQKDAIPYNYVYCSEAQSLASKMSQGTGKTSSLMFGIQWDLVCKFLEVNSDLSEADINSDSSNWGNYGNATFILKRGKYASVMNLSKWYAYTEDYIFSTYEGVINGEKKGVDFTLADVLITAGATEYTNRMNIYDLAGNEEEWTLEYASSETGSPSAHRGGFYRSNGSSSPASGRYYRGPTYSDDYRGLRSALY